MPFAPLAGCPVTAQAGPGARAGISECRDRSGKQAAKQGDSRCEYQHIHVDPNITQRRQTCGPERDMAPSNYFIYREQNRVFEDAGIYQADSVSVTGQGNPEQVQALDVTGCA